VRVVFNRLSTLKPKTGVGHYAARLFAALERSLPSDALHGFPAGRLAAAVRRAQAGRTGSPTGGQDHSIIGRLKGWTRSIAREAGRAALGLAFRAACRRGGYELYHEPNFIPLVGGVPAVVTVHDLSVILHPEWHPADRVRHHEQLFYKGLAAARHIITVSSFVRREVIEHLGVAPSRVTAVPNGVGPEYFAAGPADADAVRRELHLPPDYLLYVSTIEPRKNVMTLLRAYCDLPSALRQRCPLVLAGGWGWKASDVAEFIHAHAADKGVMHLGYTDDRHLPGLYAGARALVFPSHYEGFGLPPLEMLAAGGAVISSTAAACHEVLGGHAHFVEPLDVVGWRDALARAITDDDWLATLRRGGRERARLFSWERCAAETAAVYRSIVPPVRRAA
jgi:glycosyltransferase involved in cell wall biosynthesis